MRSEISGANVVIIGRSLIVGKPLALLLQNEGATVTMCHSRTRDLKEHTLNADIIASAVGREEFLDKSFFKTDQTQTLIDVGINKGSDGKLCGDMNTEDLLGSVKAITPVPGGVRLMTVISLMENLILAAKRQRK